MCSFGHGLHTYYVKSDFNPLTDGIMSINLMVE